MGVPNTYLLLLYLPGLKDALAEALACFSKNVARHILVAEDLTRIDGLQKFPERFEARVQRGQRVWPQAVGLGPVRPSPVADHDAFEAFEKNAIWNGQPIGSCQQQVSAPSHQRHTKIENSLPLYYSNPASPLAVAGTKPNIVSVGEAYFEGAVGSQAARILELRLQPIAQFT